MPPPETFSGEQRAVVDEAIEGLRGRVPAPLYAWLPSPEFARRAQRLGEFVRYQTSLEPRLSELAILVTARHWTSQYEWYAHKKEALRAGLAAEIVEAIAARREPVFAHADEAVVYQFARAVHERHGVDDVLFRRASQTLEERALSELVGLLGYYSLVAMTLNVYEIGLPAGTENELAP